MAKYMLLLRGGATIAGATPDELQAIARPYIEWSERLRAEGRLLGSEPLAAPLCTVRAGGRGEVAVDGPYAETKEGIGGYFLIEAADADDAVAVAGGCPILATGGLVDIRPVVGR